MNPSSMLNRARRAALALLLASSTLSFLPAPAAAQAAEIAGIAAADDWADDGGTEIIVTAQRREQSIQKVPISIAAFAGEQLENANIISVHHLGQVAPNFQAMKGAQSTTVRLNIRGVGAAGNNAVEPSVAVFVDGIYVPRAGAIVGTMMDIGHVEVLRGPQGTLFGRNASVGALSLRTAAPKQEFSGEIMVQAGTGDRYRVDGHVNVPIGPDVALRVAGMKQWFGGYWHNRQDGRQLGGLDDSALRATLRAELGDLTWTVRGDYARSTGDGFVNMDLDANSVTPEQLEAFRLRLGGALPDTNLNDRTLNQFVDARLVDRQWGVSSEMALALGDARIKLINSFRDWKNNQSDGDTVYTPLPIITRVSAYRSKSHNHELQFISPEDQWLNGALNLVSGLYYFSEDYAINEQIDLGGQYCNVIVPVGAGRDTCNAYLAAGNGAGATNLLMTQKAESFAAYAQATYALVPGLDLTIGGRWTKDKKKGSFDQAIATPFAAALRAPEVLTLPRISEDEFTYRFNLSYSPVRDVMLFATYSTGYKSGGYNSGGGVPALSEFAPDGSLLSTQRVFGKESVKNYEFGARTSWLDRALTANITFYRMDIGGYQDRAFDGTSFTVRNAGNLRQQGFEFDTILTPARGFSVNAALSYLDSEFTSFPGASGLPGLGGVQDLTGKPATYSPKWTGSVGMEVNGSVGASDLSWQFNTNLSFVSDQYIGAVTDANPQTIEDGHALLSARLALHGPDDRWTLAIFGSNLTNVSYATVNYYQILDGLFGVRNGKFPGSTAIRKLRADPRTVGASLTVRF